MRYINNFKKKVVAIVTILCVALAMVNVPSNVAMAEELTWGNFYYVILDNGTQDDTSDDTVEITGHKVDFTLYDLEIPSEIRNMPVTSIGEEAFYLQDEDYELVMSEHRFGYIIIPETVTHIGDGAFKGLSSLQSITIPDSVTSVGSSAFEQCDSLKSVKLSKNMTSIENRMFYGCYDLQTITIPEGVKSIGEEAFYQCSNLSNVKISKGVKSIGDYAFTFCGLIELTIPEGVTSIGYAAFSSCDELTSITIPNSVTSIGDSAFSSCEGLTSITIPDSVTSIGDYVFNYCSGLTSITIPNSVTSIGDHAFCGCKGLTEVTIPGSVTNIGVEAFDCCFGLKEVTISDGVTSIGNYAFDSCHVLEKVTVPKSVTSIGYWAFGIETDAVIYTYRNSYAASWAEKNYTVEYLDEEPDNPGTDNPGTDNPGTDNPGTDTPSTPNVTPNVSVTYHTHIQSYGDSQGTKKNGEMAGTSGEAKRLENIWIDVEGNDNLGVQYSTHCQSYGWMPWSCDGETNGTSGEAKRLEAIKIQLTGADKDKYDIYYRVHAQSYGWLGWAKNGEPSGTAGYAKRLEGIQVVVVKKGEAGPALNYAGVDGSSSKYKDQPYVAAKQENIVIPGDVNAPIVSYKTHVQSFGWQKWVHNGAMSGTSGQAKRLEGINIKVTNCPYEGDIVYTTHVQTYGWQGKPDDATRTGWKKNGEMSGTSGEAKRLEAICIDLTGEMGEKYDIYYRVHAQSFGWLGWAKNGEESGTAGYAKRLEGIQIVLVPAGGEAPANDFGGIASVDSRAYVEK